MKGISASASSTYLCICMYLRDSLRHGNIARAHPLPPPGMRWLIRGAVRGSEHVADAMRHSTRLTCYLTVDWNACQKRGVPVLPRGGPVYLLLPPHHKMACAIVVRYIRRQREKRLAGWLTADGCGYGSRTGRSRP